MDRAPRNLEAVVVFDLQRPAPPPLAAPPSHPRHHLRRPPQSNTAGRDDTHSRIRYDRIDTTGAVTLRLNGRVHHIGIGRTHARTHLVLLVDDHRVRVVNAATGELLRDLTIDPNRGYQPTGAPKGPTRPHAKRPEPN